jgi:hypothetical protein
MREVQIAGKTYVLAYKLSDREPIEKACEKPLWDAMTSGLLVDQATIICFGLRHADRKITPNGVIALLEKHLEQNEDYSTDVLRPAYWAAIEGKLLGAYNRDEMVRIWGDPDAPKGVAPKTVAASQDL